MAELPPQAKYERLAQEYSRLRSNATVLKKAVVQEQETNTKLTERVKSAEMAQRKQEQELDALRFRNQQLVKRVEVLQADLDTAHAPTRKRPNAAKPAGGDLPPDTEVLMEQLQTTIEANARLNGQLVDSSAQHDAQLRKVRDELHRVHEQHKHAEEELRAECVSLQDQISLLRDEKLTLEKQVVEKEAQLQQRHSETTELRRRLDAITAGVSEQQSTQEDRPLVPQGPALLPTAREASAAALRLLRGLKEWHDNLAQRLSLPYGPLRATTQLTQSVTKCSTAAAALESEMAGVETTLKEARPHLPEERLSVLRDRLREYAAHLTASTGPLVSRTEDENGVSFCPPALAKRNSETAAALTEMAAATQELCQCADGEGRTPADVGVRLRTAGRELARLFNCKVSLEQKLTDVSDEVKAANEALVHGLLVARSALDKLSPLLADSLFSSSGQRVLTAVLQAGSASPLPNGVSEESGRLEREVAALKASMKELEAARDSLGLEAQLERLRREKEVQKRTELEKELLSLRSHSPGGSLDATDLTEPDQRSPTAVANSAEREAVIVTYYQEIVARQQQQLYQLTGIAENLKVEADNARAQWSLSLSRTTSLEQEVQDLGTHTKSVTDDLDSTRRNYEAQISTLTEHIADMNDKLIQRQENIEELRRQMEIKEPKRKFSASAILPEPARLRFSAAFLPSVSKRK